MSDQKQGLPIKWVVIILTCLAALGFWTHMIEQNILQSSQSNTPSALPVKPQQNTSTADSSLGIQSSISEDNEGNSSKQKTLAVEQIGNTNTSTQPNSPSKKNAILKEIENASEASSNNKTNLQEGTSESNKQSNTTATVNAIPTQAEIMASLNLQNQQHQALTKALSDRTTQIEKTHQAIMDSFDSNSSNQGQEVVPYTLPPPADITEKVKSHQLNAFH